MPGAIEARDVFQEIHEEAWASVPVEHRKPIYQNILKFAELHPKKTRIALATRGGSNSVTFGARETEVEEPLWDVKSVLFELEVDEVVEPKALTPEEFKQLISRYGSSVKASKAIGASEAFTRQNSKRRIRQPIGK